MAVIRLSASGVIFGRMSRPGRLPMHGPGLPVTARVVVRMLPEERRRLQDDAAGEHQPVSDLIRSAVNDYVDDLDDQRVFAPEILSPKD